MRNRVGNFARPSADLTRLRRTELFVDTGSSRDLQSMHMSLNVSRFNADYNFMKDDGKRSPGLRSRTIR